MKSKWSWPSLVYYPRIRLEGLRKTMKIHGQDSCCPWLISEASSLEIKVRTATWPSSPGNMSQFEDYNMPCLTTSHIPAVWLILILIIFWRFPFNFQHFKDLERNDHGVRGTAVGWGTMLQAGRSWVWFPMSLDFSIDLILPAASWTCGPLSL
jgi:hypothetical protein